MRELRTEKEITWCPGCGDFGILSAFKKAVSHWVEEGNDADRLAITTGIGCHGKIFDYLNLSGFYSLHGRGTATAQGIKLANPGLTVVSFGGDGDSLGEGLTHTLFAAKRNMDITLILHNNGTYGLTTGQFTPLSTLGYKGPTTPGGNIEKPFHALSLLREAGATFIARTYTTRLEHMTEVFGRALTHRGFAVVEVLQPCVSFNNTYEFYNEHTEIMTGTPAREDMAGYLHSVDPIYLGIFEQRGESVFHDQFYAETQGFPVSVSQTERLHVCSMYLDPQKGALL